ncbi:MAG: ABC transporter ATP-binding protein, partial [Candidatus Bipolaricaulota bacterium]|nr:ABC transporter ATP-binding protein [Candidatus Bipolaricaulota bacterium]
MRRSRGELFKSIVALTGRRFPLYAASLVIWGVIVAFCFNLVIALVFQDVMNASTGGDASLLLRAVALALGTFLLGLPFWCLAQYGLSFALYRSKTDLRGRLFERVAGVPLSKIEGVHSGDVISRCTNDVDAAFSMLGERENFSPAVFMFLIGFGIIFGISWKLGLASLVMSLGFLVLSIPATRVLKPRSEALQAALGAMTERLSDLLAGLSVTRMLGREDRVLDVYAAASSDVAKRKIAQARAQAAFEAADAVLGWVQSLALLTFALLLFRSGVLMIGAVWAVVRVQWNTSWLFQSAGQIRAMIQRGLAGGERVFALLDEPLERPAQASLGEPSRTAHLVLDVRDLCFRYTADGPTRAALRGVNLSAAEGEVIALVGASGGGKSTLVKLLLGLYPDYEGQILVAGLDVRDADLVRIRECIGYVPQDAYLFDGTIEENVAMGKPGATHEEIVRAAKAAHAHDFILEQPDAYNTKVGERGAKLSGGQRQRIA